MISNNRTSSSIIFLFAFALALMCCSSTTTVNAKPQQQHHHDIPSKNAKYDDSRFVTTTTVVIGDLHGDLEQAKILLHRAGVVDAKGHWKFGTNYLVQMGDLMDQGVEDIPLVEWFMGLQQEAKKAGGSVDVILGNHEAYNLREKFSMVRKKALREEGGRKNRAELLQPSEPIGRWLRTLPLMHVHDGVLFVHGGASADTFKYCKSVKALNRAVTTVLMNEDTHKKALAKEHPFHNAETESDLCLEYARAILSISGKKKSAELASPIEMRMLPSGQGAMPASHCKSVEAALDAVNRGGVDGNVTSMVGAHTPHRNWHRQYCIVKVDGQTFARFIEIDYHLSRWKGGVLGRGAVLFVRAKFDKTSADGRGAVMVDRSMILEHYSEDSKGHKKRSDVGPDGHVVHQYHAVKPIRVETVGTAPFSAVMDTVNGAVHSLEKDVLPPGVQKEEKELEKEGVQMGSALVWILRLIGAIVLMCLLLCIVCCCSCCKRCLFGSSGSNNKSVPLSGVSDRTELTAAVPNYGSTSASTSAPPTATTCVDVHQ